MAKIITNSGRELRLDNRVKPEALMESLTQIVKRHVPDAEPREDIIMGMGFSANADRGWGCSVSLYVRTNIERYPSGHGTEARPDNRIVYCIEPCEVSWSSTGHRVASAVCAVTLYQAMIAAAAEIDTAWGKAFIYAEE